MTKFFYILLLFILGIALIPSDSLACGSKSEKYCCDKKNSKDCCKSDTENWQNENGCGRKCGDKSCDCPASHFSLITILVQENINIVSGFSDKKQKFGRIQANLLSRSNTIWTPPNIG